ncbi:hypothetical protein CSOJ01_09018 [Colletotrichum sojae]|uniref:Uncharacterized protein n=1 Tax=Colletotrichum sojae TaxID=2175907 RepID=A0A8H6MR78_9PEZI|nr:hypothetical protein CSOJ01_09018 [Colletotrichum sojae]
MEMLEQRRKGQYTTARERVWFARLHPEPKITRSGCSLAAVMPTTSLLCVFSATVLAMFRLLKRNKHPSLLALVFSSRFGPRISGRGDRYDPSVPGYLSGPGDDDNEEVDVQKVYIFGGGKLLAK